MTHSLHRYLLILSLACLATSAQATTTLRMAHFWPGASSIGQDIFEKWAATIEEESGGELRAQIYPSGTLSKPDSIYEAAVNGIADIGATAQGYTAGRFPLSQIVELPGVSTSSSQGACIVQTLFDEGYFGSEYADTRPLFMFTTGPGYLHTRSVDVVSPDDVQGLRIRRPNDAAGLVLENLDATPVGMPAPDIYTAMQRGVIDGLSFPWEAMKVFRLNELANHHIEVPLMSVIFVVTMNQRSYDNLSPASQAVIDANSGMKWAEKAGEVYEALDTQGKAEALQAGHTIHEVENPLENPDWQQPLNDGIESYLTQLEERGLDQARAVYGAAIEARETSCASEQG
ncbi:TRAP transporter substrate-binding protein [Vreelandella glaciei]|uniref:TRAP transporter substrate-binding protein n=1 Tax=Vreelandella glaciei TaxID=186761 RepID=UPI0030011BBE